MLTLYDFLPSGNGYRVRLTLFELGISFKYRQVDILKGETRERGFIDKNPTGQIPVIELADGTCISESTAILFFLADGTHLLPTDKLDRIRVLQWLCFEQTNVDGVISRARFRRQFPGVVPTRPARSLRGRSGACAAGGGALAAALADAPAPVQDGARDRAPLPLAR